MLRYCQGSRHVCIFPTALFFQSGSCYSHLAYGDELGSVVLLTFLQPLKDLFASISSSDSEATQLIAFGVSVCFHTSYSCCPHFLFFSVRYILVEFLLFMQCKYMYRYMYIQTYQLSTAQEMYKIMYSIPILRCVHALTILLLPSLVPPTPPFFTASRRTLLAGDCALLSSAAPGLGASGGVCRPQ